MAVHSFEDLIQHAGHELEIVYYGPTEEEAWNVAIECLICCEVLLDFDKGEGEQR